MKRKIMLLEDNKRISEYYKKMLENENYNVKTALNSQEFFNIYNDFQPDLILLDIVLKNSELNGIEVFKKIKESPNFNSKVIILSSEASKTQVVEAMKLGAVNFNEKGENFNRIKFLADIRQAIEIKAQEEELLKLKTQSINSLFIGEHPKAKYVKELIRRYSQSDVNLLIIGETGTGKGLVAELIHNNSKRKNGPFKSIDIKTIPESLLESELFGHKKGAFTGATADKKGYFEAADGGTLFIDEISNLSMTNQMQILKVIEEKKIPIVGSGGQTKIIDTRIITATNVELTKLIEKNEFRTDLYFRLAGCTIFIPPLRERKSDIPLLMEKFLIQFTREYNKSLDIDLKEIKDKLENYSFPGNVRELKNFCKFVSQIYNRIDNDVILEEFENHINKVN